MTTTVCDLTNRLLTADTRWSCGSRGDLVLSDGNRYFVYCDETGFDKISIVGNTALVTAGSGPLIAQWREWWEGDADPDNHPPLHSNGEFAIVFSIIDLENSVTLFDKGPKSVLYCQVTEMIKAYCFGSGAHHASSSLMNRGCAQEAVKYASQNDICTSDIVKYVCYKTHQNNLGAQTNDYSVIVDGISKRGYMMELSPVAKNVVKIDEHSLGEEVKQLFKTGSAVASAPVPGIKSCEWTSNDEDSFKDAMKKVHELRRKQ